MPDNKTVTFDASQWQPIETAPKDGMTIILSNGNDVHTGEWVHDEGGITEHRDMDGRYINQTERDGFIGWMDASGGMQPEPTHWMPLPAAPGSTPTPAAQSVGQEAVAHIATRKMDGERFLVWPNNVASYKKYTDDFDVVDLYAAPVNGGEPVFLAPIRKVSREELAEMYSECECPGCEGKPAPQNNPCAVCGKRASDAQQATAINAELLEALKEIAMNDPFQQSAAGHIARAAIEKAKGGRHD